MRPLLLLVVAQGALGYIQYTTQVPAILTEFHVTEHDGRLGGRASLGVRSRTAPAPSLAVAPWAAGEVSGPIAVLDPETTVSADRPWNVVVWNDPINLMQYVTFVFKKLFGYSESKAHTLMMDVHLKGRAIVSFRHPDRGGARRVRLHEYGLWATLEHDE